MEEAKETCDSVAFYGTAYIEAKCKQQKDCINKPTPHIPSQPHPVLHVPESTRPSLGSSARELEQKEIIPDPKGPPEIFFFRCLVCL